MTYSELIQLYFERSNALQWYWTLYVIIIGGLLAFSSLRQRRDAITGVLVTILFCFFAYKNAGAIHDVTMQRASVLENIRSMIAAGHATDLMQGTLVSPAWDGVRNFHIASDILTILAVWAMEWRRIKMAKAPTP